MFCEKLKYPQFSAKVENFFLNVTFLVEIFASLSNEAFGWEETRMMIIRKIVCINSTCVREAKCMTGKPGILHARVCKRAFTQLLPRLSIVFTYK